MKMTMRVLAALAGSCFAAAAWSWQSAETPGDHGYRISGAVVDHLTNRPLNQVLVRLSMAAGRGEQLTSLTGSDGRFAFVNLPPGKYRLSAQRRGESQQAFHNTGSYSTAIVVGPGIASEEMIFPLRQMASISGTVLDDEGEPVNYATILLFAQSVTNGEIQIGRRSGGATNSLGQFRLGQLEPGTYFLAVQGTPWFAGPNSRPARSPETDVAYPLTYYGGATDADSAAPIVLAEGTSMRVQVQLRAMPNIHVHLGGVRPEGHQNTIANVFARGPGDTLIRLGWNMSVDPDGYELSGVPAGRYVVQVQSYAELKSQGTATAVAELADGMVLPIQRASKITVSGQVTFEGTVRPAAKMLIFLSAANGGPGANAEVGPDGAFAVPAQGLLPGQYAIHLNGPDLYMRSVEVKGARKIGDSIELLENSSATLSILAGSTGSLAKLDGLALSMTDNKPVPGAMALLVPQDLTRGALFRRDQSDSDGSFTFAGVQPGRYTVVAIDDGRDLAYKDPAVIRPYLAGGQTVSVPVLSSEALKVGVQKRVQ